MTEPFDRSEATELSRSAALTCAAGIMLLPANLLPVLDSLQGGTARSDTIYSGVVELWQQGLWPIAAIVFTASFLIPMLKIVGLVILLIAARFECFGHPRALTRLYSILNFIGRWSMLDVFLGVFLAGVVNFRGLASIAPRSGLIAFAAVVVLTVLATSAFDPRIFWQGAPIVSGESES